MRPVIVINHLLEPGGRITGISSYLFSLLRELVREGSFHYALATSWQAADLEPLLPTDALSIYTYPTIASQPRNILAQKHILAEVVRETGAVLEFNPNPVGSVAGRLPRVMTVHDLYFDVAPRNYAFRHRLWWKLFFPRNVARADAIVCVSHETRRTLEKLYPHSRRKTAVVHEAGASGPPSCCGKRMQGGEYGLFVGNLSPNKGSGTLVEAMDILADRGVETPIFHVGRDETGAIDAALAHSRSKKRPQSLGHVSEEKLRHLYSHAGFLAFPSTYEGFGLPVLEAQSFGVPVVASDIAVLREVAGEGAVFFPPGDARAMADGILGLMNRPAEWSRLSERARDNAARFSWSRAARETAAIFERVLDRKAG